jgi:DNA-binding Xre family transcriptional regulator
MQQTPKGIGRLIEERLSGKRGAKTRLAADLGVHRNTLKRWIDGDLREARWADVETIARAVDMDPRDLVDVTGRAS